MVTVKGANNSVVAARRKESTACRAYRGLESGILYDFNTNLFTSRFTVCFMYFCFVYFFLLDECAYGV